MKNLIKKFTKKQWVIAGVVLAVALIAVYFIFIKNDNDTLQHVTAQKQTLRQEVSVTGKVEPVESVELAFDVSGRVIWKNVEVGSKVSAGQSIAAVFNDDTRSKLAEAEATLKSQEAKLEELKRGTRVEEILIYETKVLNAEDSLADARNNLRDKIIEVELKSDDAVRNRADQFFSNPRTSDPKISGITVNDSGLRLDLEGSRITMEDILVSWDNSVKNISADNVKEKLSEAKSNSSQIGLFIEKMSIAINSLTPTASLSQTTIDAYKADIYTARTNMSAAISAVTTAEEKLKTAESALLLAKNELALKQSGSSSEQITSQEAVVEQARASVLGYKAQLAKTYITSPIKGIVTKIDAKVGQIVTAGSPVISIISEKSFQIETNIPEADIAKIKIGNQAKVTLDAYGDSIIFEASAIKIDPAETVVEGVSTYKVTLEFSKDYPEVRSGMTANIDILTAQKEGVVAVPSRVIIEKNGNKFVEILNEDESTTERTVKTGLKGTDGNVEIIEGISEGDKIIIPVKK